MNEWNIFTLNFSVVRSLEPFLQFEKLPLESCGLLWCEWMVLNKNKKAGASIRFRRELSLVWVYLIFIKYVESSSSDRCICCFIAGQLLNMQTKHTHKIRPEVCIAHFAFISLLKPNPFFWYLAGLIWMMLLSSAEFTGPLLIFCWAIIRRSRHEQIIGIFSNRCLQNSLKFLTRIQKKFRGCSADCVRSRGVLINQNFNLNKMLKIMSN